MQVILNLVERLNLHNTKGAKFTKNKNWVLIYKKISYKIFGYEEEYLLKKTKKKKSDQENYLKKLVKISILLPYKENYSKDYAGAVSIFINGLNNKVNLKNQSKSGNEITQIFSQKIILISLFKKNYFIAHLNYLKNFIELEKKENQI